MKTNIKAFISYSKQDKDFFKLIVKNLKSHFGISTVFNYDLWDDREICIGANWHEEIQDAINKSDFAILLVSSDFLTSEYVKKHEIENFILKQTKEQFLYFPILVRDCDFTLFEKLSKIQFFVAHGDDYGIPRKKGELITFSELARFDSNNILIPNPNLDTYFKNLVNAIEKAIINQKKKMN